jgi:hypothetical protein
MLPSSSINLICRNVGDFLVRRGRNIFRIYYGNSNDPTGTIRKHRSFAGISSVIIIAIYNGGKINIRCG